MAVCTTEETDSKERTSAVSGRTTEPGRSDCRCLAMAAVFIGDRPRMAALAPKRTNAATWAEHIVPAPPVQRTTLPAVRTSS